MEEGSVAVAVGLTEGGLVLGRLEGRKDGFRFGASVSFLIGKVVLVGLNVG